MQPKKKPVADEEPCQPKPIGGCASVYVCLMHPDVCAERPGDCPKCGMRLEEQRATEEKS